MQLALWLDCLQTINTRSQIVFKLPDFTDYCYDQIQYSFQKSRRYNVTTASPMTYQIDIGNNRSHIVKFESPPTFWEDSPPESGKISIICTCNYPQDYNIPCKHTIIALREVREDFTCYYQMVTWYSVATYRNTYSFPIEPIRLEDFKDIQL